MSKSVSLGRNSVASKFQIYKNVVLQRLRENNIGCLHQFQAECVLKTSETLLQNELDEDGLINPVVVAAPVGAGKCSMIVLLPYALGSQKVLITTPSKVISKLYADAFCGKQYWKTVFEQILDINSMETVKIFNDADDIYDDNELPNVVILRLRKFRVSSTLLSDGNRNKFQDYFKDFDTLIIDEAHIYTPGTCSTIAREARKLFKNVIFFTASPFKNVGGQKRFILGNGNENLIAYTVTSDMVLGVSTRPCRFDEKPHHPSNEQVYQDIKELIEENCEREPRFDSQAMILVRTITEANELVMYMNQKADDKAFAIATLESRPEALQMFSDGKYRVAVACGDGLEGYDNANVTVCVILRKVTCTFLFSQFVGRCLRMKRGLADNDPDKSIGIVLSYEKYEMKNIWKKSGLSDQSEENYNTEDMIDVDVVDEGFAETKNSSQLQTKQQHESDLHFGMGQSVENESETYSKPKDESEPDGGFLIHYDTDSPIADGSNGTVVYEGTFGQRNVAVKVVNESIADQNKPVNAEIKALVDVDGHKNVLRYYHVERRPKVGKFLIALELCQATLDDWVQDNKCIAAAISKREILMQVVKGIAHLHEWNILHRDLKPTNILFRCDGKTAVVKIADFGLSKYLPCGRSAVDLSCVVGTDRWRAPEILEYIRQLELQKLAKGNSMLQNITLSRASDIFPLGCVFYFVLTDGFHPFGDTSDEICPNIRNDKPTLQTQNTRGEPYTYDVVSSFPLIREMIRKEPKNRPNAYNLLRHHALWKDGRAIEFLIDVGKECERQTYQVNKCRSEVNRRYNDICIRGNGWLELLCPIVSEYLQTNNHRRFTGRTAMDLVRAIRNLYLHFANIPLNVQTALGDSTKESHARYWFPKFPYLVHHVWMGFQYMQKTKSLSEYYPENYDFVDEF